MRKFDLLVIGGGLAGCATAYFATRLGASVALLERRDLNLAASGSNAGSIHAQIPFDPFRQMGEQWARDYARTIPLFMASIRRWGELEDELDGSLGVSARGGLMVAADDGDMALLERKVAIEREAGLPVELWDRSRLASEAPFLNPGIAGASFCPIEGKADPFKATPLFARRAAERGATIVRNAEVMRIDRDAAGFSVHSDAGVYRADRLVNAAGADAAAIGRMVGVDVALEGHPIQVSVTEKRPALLPWLVYFTGEKLTLKQSADGGYLIGGGWPANANGGRPSVNLASLARNLSIAEEVMPGLSGVSVVRSWAAVVNGTADWQPILGEAPGVPGFFFNLFPWMGFTAAPAISEAIAHLALGRKPELDLAPFSLS